MCGVYGFVFFNKPNNFNIRGLAEEMMDLVELRGSDGTGILRISNEEVSVHKSFLKPSEFKRQKEFQIIKSQISNSKDSCFIVQGRLATSGSVSLDNQHPLVKLPNFLFHNGIYLDSHSVDEFKDLSDSWKLFDYILENDKIVSDAITMMSSENNFALVDTLNSKLLLGSNTGSLFSSSFFDGNLVIFGSEPIKPKAILPKTEDMNLQIKGAIQLSIPKTRNAIEPKVTTMGRLTINESKGFCKKCGLTRKAFTQFTKRSELCFRCLDQGTDSNRDSSKRAENLNELLANKRVVVGFSGGRDSSYALLKLRAIPGIEIIAVSYDWGGVTDLGRRNQSRVCGILGIEHVWISADIEKKRRNVQKNLLAWIKNPSLVTIPLMLAGDKAMWKYPLKIAKKREADFVIYCTNPIERTDFKVALAGVKSRSKSTRPQLLANYDRFHLILKYILELLRNPRLLNSSLLDSIYGFKYYFFDSEKNLQYFDYDEWREDIVNEALKNQLNWEFNHKRQSSWRIGDITTPFYNLAYYCSLGFTEFDTFRSNQVRAGHINIEQSWKLLELDNLVDLDGLMQYSLSMGVPVLSIMRGIERLTRKYNGHGS